LANPISADMSVMRTSLWAGLVQTAQYNQSRQQTRVRIFESGLRFHRQQEEIVQPQGLAGLVCGERLPEQWSEASPRVDFYDLKGDIEALLALTGEPGRFSFRAQAHPVLHPGQSAAILRGEEQIGVMGMLHPELEKRLDLHGATYLFEIDLEGILLGRLPAFESLSKFPSIRRDIAIVVENNVTFESIRNVIREASGKIIKDIRPFDVYTGENIDSGRKSVALGLILQEKSHTLTDQEVDGVIETVLRRLSDELDAKLRD
jgi:phenylalanyl-tRNA synthetase beta chain